MSRRCLLVLAAMLASNPALFARRPPPARTSTDRTSSDRTPIDDFERMSPEQQQRALRRLPPGQRQKFEERLQRFNRLPAEQQRTLRNLYNRLHQLPPNQQEAVRKAINRFSAQAPNRQQAMRDELRSLAASPQPDREARMASPEFRGRFNRREQTIIREMTPLLPDR
jgi:phage-related protein